MTISPDRPSTDPNPFTRLEACEALIPRIALLQVLACTSPAQLDGMAVGRALAGLKADLRLALYGSLESIADQLAEDHVEWAKGWALELYPPNRAALAAHTVERWDREYTDTAAVLRAARSEGKLAETIRKLADAGDVTTHGGHLAALDDAVVAAAPTGDAGAAAEG